jgi:peptidase M28-like protein
VFVGYGISDPARNFDEYAGVEVRDRIVLFLRGKPDGYTGMVAQVDKVRTAHEKAAIAFLTATGPLITPYEARRGLSERPMASYGSSRDHPLPGAWLSSEAVATIVEDLSQERRSLRDIQERLNRREPQSFPTGVRVRLAWDSSETRGLLYNVVASLPGYDHRVTDQTVLIGAHRDHFGRQAGLLFPGADDNASGTAVLLEIARVLATSGARPRRSVLFLSFSGEEESLLGSRLYVSRPSRPLKEAVAMINVDHAGIGNGRLTVGIAGLEQTIATEAGRLAGLADQLDLFGFFPGGDHVPFKDAGVPTIALVTSGAHPHFHQPSDTPDTLRPEILEAAARYVLALTWRLAN